MTTTPTWGAVAGRRVVRPARASRGPRRAARPRDLSPRPRPCSHRSRRSTPFRRRRLSDPGLHVEAVARDRRVSTRPGTLNGSPRREARRGAVAGPAEDADGVDRPGPPLPISRAACRVVSVASLPRPGSTGRRPSRPSPSIDRPRRSRRGPATRPGGASFREQLRRRDAGGPRSRPHPRRRGADVPSFHHRPCDVHGVEVPPQPADPAEPQRRQHDAIERHASRRIWKSSNPTLSTEGSRSACRQAMASALGACPSIPGPTTRPDRRQREGPRTDQMEGEGPATAGDDNASDMGDRNEDSDSESFGKALNCERPGPASEVRSRAFLLRFDSTPTQPPESKLPRTNRPALPEPVGFTGREIRAVHSGSTIGFFRPNRSLVD